jgi:hypothetical protein
MKKRFIASLLASLLIASGTILPSYARAQSNASTLSALSMLPVASVVVGAGAAASTVVAIPAMLSVAGTVLVVKAVEVSVHGTVLVLERASDGARVSLRIAGDGLAASGLVVGSAVAVSVIGAGVILSAAGEAIAFIPNALGQALLHNERLTY